MQFPANKARYELNSLRADGPLAKQLSAELEKQMKAVGFTQ